MSSANLHSPERQLIELRIEHADLNAMIDRMAHDTPVDELLLMRMKKRRLALRDQIQAGRVAENGAVRRYRR